MAIDRGQFREVYMPKMVERINLEVDNADKTAEWKKLFVEKSSDTAYVETKAREGMGPLVATNDRGALSELYLGDGYSKRITQYKYAGIVTYPMEVLLFEQTDIIAEHTKALGRAPGYLKEILCASMFEYGDTAIGSITQVNGRPIIDPLSADGQTLFNATHTYKSNNAATWANLTTTNLTLNRANYQTHVKVFLKWQGANGEYLNAEPRELIVPVALRDSAYELCGSQFQPDTALNAVNSVKMDLKEGDFLVWKRLTSTADWYIRTSYPNRFIIRTALKPKTEKGYDGKNGQVHWVSLTTLFSMGCDDPRSIFACKA